MTTKEIYELDPNKWVVYVQDTINKSRILDSNPTFMHEDEIEYLLFSRKHKHIVDAVIANPNVEVKFFSKNRDIDNKRIWQSFDDFFNHYDSDLDYRLAKPQCDGSFNGGYIKASQEAYDLLVEMGYKTIFNYNEVANCNITILNVKNNKFTQNDYIGGFLGKQFYINDKALSWEESKGNGVNKCNAQRNTNNNADVYNPDNKATIEETNEVDNSNSNDSSVSDSELGNLSIVDEDGKVYEFEKPEFETELYSVKPQDGTMVILGAFYSSDGKWHTGKWAIDGCVGSRYNSLVSLIPTQKPWHENKDNFPALITDGSHFAVAYEKNCEFWIDENATQWASSREWRLATKEEHQSLFYQGKQDA